MRTLDIEFGSGIAFILLISPDVVTTKALVLILIIQLIRYKWQIYKCIQITTHEIKTIDAVIEYMHHAQFNRTAIKFNLYLILIGAVFGLYAIAATHPYIWLAVKCLAVAVTLIV